MFAAWGELSVRGGSQTAWVTEGFYFCLLFVFPDMNWMNNLPMEGLHGNGGKKNADLEIASAIGWIHPSSIHSIFPSSLKFSLYCPFLEDS